MQGVIWHPFLLNDMKITVIITAGGIGKRMGGDLPKQFLLLNGKPVLLHTLERFHSILPEAQFIITLPAEWQSYWNELLTDFQVSIAHHVIDGGSERFHSVKNALTLAEGGYILVHDAVRPLFSKETIEKCLQALETNEAVVPVVPVKESLRETNGTESKALDRSRFVLVQTPQCFHKQTLIEAYDQPYDSTFTDDASVVERNGGKVILVTGNEENIKLTTPADLQLAEVLMEICN
jgi:2-C-methyl-D-erythritol 4-phosphate cytidylyltransferase